MTRIGYGGRCRRVVLGAAGTLLLAAAFLPAVTAQAQEESGSALGSFDLAATAPGFNVRVEDGGYCGPGPTAGCEGVAPEAVARLQNGPVSYALSSIAWPGTLAGNLGTLLIVAGGSSVPQQATQLNDPVRAEARTGEKANNTSVPGATMTADAGRQEVTAVAQTPATQAPGVGTFGSVSGTSRAALTGPSTAVATAQSRITDIAVAGGQLKVANLTSLAEATTDGTTATVNGTTTASGASIAGIPVTIDDRGITVAGNNQGVNSIATATVNQVVSALGIKVALISPTGTPKGSAVDYNAGSLLVSWTPQADKRITVVLGGATVTVNAVPGFPVASTGGAPGIPPAETGPLASDLTGSSFAPQFTNPPDLSGSPMISGPAPSAAPSVAAPALAPSLASSPLQLPAGNGVAIVLLALAGAGLVTAGLHRLPGSVLAAPSARCPLEEDG